jgi:hypothetical protein
MVAYSVDPASGWLCSRKASERLQQHLRGDVAKLSYSAVFVLCLWLEGIGEVPLKSILHCRKRHSELLNSKKRDKVRTIWGSLESCGEVLLAEMEDNSCRLRLASVLGLRRTS